MKKKSIIVTLAFALSLLASCATNRLVDYDATRISLAQQNLKRIPSYIKGARTSKLSTSNKTASNTFPPGSHNSTASRKSTSTKTKCASPRPTYDISPNSTGSS